MKTFCNAEACAKLVECCLHIHGGVLQVFWRIILGDYSFRQSQSLLFRRKFHSFLHSSWIFTKIWRSAQELLITIQYFQITYWVEKYTLDLKASKPILRFLDVLFPLYIIFLIVVWSSLLLDSAFVHFLMKDLFNFHSNLIEPVGSFIGFKFL